MSYKIIGACVRRLNYSNAIFHIKPYNPRPLKKKKKSCPLGQNILFILFILFTLRNQSCIWGVNNHRYQHNLVALDLGVKPITSQSRGKGEDEGLMAWVCSVLVRLQLEGWAQAWAPRLKPWDQDPAELWRGQGC